MKIDHEFALIELTDQEADEYNTGTGCYVKIQKAANDLADETDRTVEIRRESTGSLVDIVINS